VLAPFETPDARWGGQGREDDEALTNGTTLWLSLDRMSRSRSERGNEGRGPRKVGDGWNV